MRNAIGNVEYPPDEYEKIKTTLFGQISDELEMAKKLKWNIYNIDSRK